MWCCANHEIFQALGNDLQTIFQTLPPHQSTVIICAQGNHMTYTTLNLVTKNTIPTETEMALAYKKNTLLPSHGLHTCFTLHKDESVLCFVSTRHGMPTPKPHPSNGAWWREYTSEVGDWTVTFPGTPRNMKFDLTDLLSNMLPCNNRKTIANPCCLLNYIRLI